MLDHNTLIDADFVYLELKLGQKTLTYRLITSLLLDVPYFKTSIEICKTSILQVIKSLILMKWHNIRLFKYNEKKLMKDFE